MGHLHHRHVHQHHERDEQATVMNVVYVTLSKSFDGPAVMVTPGNPQPTENARLPSEQVEVEQNQRLPEVQQNEVEQQGSVYLGPPYSPDSTSSSASLQTQAPVPISSHTELDPRPPQSSSTPQSKEKPSGTTTQHVKTTQVSTRKHTTVAKHTSKSSKPAKSSSKPTPAAHHTSGHANNVNKEVVKTTSSHISQSNQTAAPISSSSSNSDGMSGGAIAGLAIGLLLGLGAIIAIVFLVYRRKKQNQGMEKLDDEKSYNEKTPINPPAPVAAPASRNQDAPHLSLRPSSQFSPVLGSNGAKPEMTQNGHLAAPVAAPASVWERRGAAQAQHDPANPFGAHAEKSESPEPPRELKVDSLAIVGGKVPESGRVSPPEQQQPPQSPTAPSIRSVSSGASVNSGFTEASEAPSTAGAAGPGGAPPSNVHRVQMDFQPTMDDELEVRAGQLVRILHNYDDGWALCIRMDRSQQGVVPRTCLSKHPLKPRQHGNGPNGPRGPRGAPGPRGPPPFAQGPRPLSPGGRNSPGPNGRPMSPAGGRNSPAPPFAGPGPRPASPLGPRGPPRGPGPRPRAGTASGPGPRSMSPGPYGPGGKRPDQPNMRRRSNSVGDISQRRQSPPSGPSPLNPQSAMPARKPVPGQAM